MKSFFSIICSIVFCVNLSAQIPARIQIVDRFNASDYQDVINDLLKQENKGLGDFESKVLLAESYYKQRDFQSANDWYQKALLINNLSKKYLLHYAATLKALGKYQLADDIYGKWGSTYQNYLSKNLNSIKPADFKVQTISMINTEGDELAPAYYKDGIVYIGNEKRKKKTYSWNGRTWLRPYYIPFKPNGEEQGKPTSYKIPQMNKHHQGPISFTRMNQMIYFSQNQKLAKGTKKGTSTLGIFSSKKRNGKWGVVEALPFNSTAYSVSHPTLSSDGREMYFVSDMPGGFGGTDIYYTHFKMGKWSDPINLGAEVNTSSDEMFPFIHSDGTLYFASEGHSGYGGLDIFYTQKVNNSWSKPVNMGKPVNSIGDDFSLILNKKKELGYLTSNRVGGKGNDDIYRLVSLQYVPTKEITIQGSVLDAQNQEPVNGVNLTFSYDGVNRETLQTDANGRFRFSYPDNAQEVRISGLKADYFPVEWVTNNPNLSSTIVNQNLEIRKVEVGKSFVVPNIYYDFDKADIRPQAKIELDRLYDLLQLNPSWVVEIGSHTDSRADANYNLKLSEERAKNVVKYLEKKGISKNRLTYKGYGETMILNGCTDGVNCSEAEHAVNRRTEFKLIALLSEKNVNNEVLKPVIPADKTKDRQIEPEPDERWEAREMTDNAPLIQSDLKTNALVYKIQLGVFKQVDARWLEHVKQLGQIEQVQMPNSRLVKVYITPFYHYADAQKALKNIVRVDGLKDAFVVAVYQNKSIPIDQAIKLEK